MLTEALTLARNFGPWFGGVAVIAFLAGGGSGAWVAHRFDAAAIASAEKATVEAQGRLAEFRGALATSVAEGKAEVARIQKEAADELLARDRRVTAALDALPAAVAAIIGPQFAELRRTVDDPRFNCLRDPLPDEFLRGVRRPGGSVGAAGSDGGPPPG